MNGSSFKHGAWLGVLLAIFIILGQPFYPAEGLIPDIVNFLITVPLWCASLLFPAGATPLVQAAAIVIYFLLVGGLLGFAYNIKPLWGWMLLVALAIHHYEIDAKINIKLGEIIPTILSRFGWS